MDVDRLIGWNFKRLRSKLGLSQEEVALRLGTFDQGYISQLEGGERNPTARTLYRLAKALNASVGELFESEGLPPEIAQSESKASGKSRAGRALPKRKSINGTASGT
ncbi:helix-turn-helix transcriptional regulator [Asticcacaulis sp. DW145]|uniref:helix-turn-helix domain-containing protein n=1 Tax=Asticcacaulis sp. DW145 TaxID=3095608 RepID=UPI0030D5A2C1